MGCSNSHEETRTVKKWEYHGNITVFLIDPQVDFHPGGSLGIPTANKDSRRLAKLIQAKKQYITRICVSLDSHHRRHIAHAVFWRKGNTDIIPKPFTTIKHQDIMDGQWRPSDASLLEYSKEYTRKLEASGQFALIIWPEHCLIGSPGHAVVPELHKAIQDWAGTSKQTIKYHYKGMNCLTEMYSAIRAEVEIPEDPTTKADMAFLNVLLSAEKLLIGGQAASHCVNLTVRDILEYWKGAGKDPRDLIVLADGCSPVPGFEDLAAAFYQDIRKAGVTVSSTKRLLSLDWRLVPDNCNTSSTSSVRESGTTADLISAVPNNHLV